MDEVRERIKQKVLLKSSVIADDEFLEDTIADVLDRALVYMNRYDLIPQYEEDLLDEDVEEVDYILPLPKPLERVIASTVVAIYKNADAEGSDPSIKSISDNGQSITYSDKVTNYLQSTDDEQIFSGTVKMLDNFRLAKIVKDDSSRQYDRGYRL